MNRQVHKHSRILDDCLESILAGDATLDECLRQLPGDAQHLAPMLELAVAAQDSLAPNMPRPGFVAASRERILSKISSRLQQTTRRDTRAPRTWRWQPAQAFIGVMIAIGILVISTGVVQAANAALPGDALYGLKRGLEHARLAVTWNAAGDMQLLAQYAGTRLEELEALLKGSRYDDMGLALEGYEQALSDLTDLAGEAGSGLDPDSLGSVLERLAHHQEVLARVSEQVPEAAQTAIAHAMERSSHSQEVIQQLREGGSPSDQAPGQQRTPSATPTDDGTDRPGQSQPDRTPPGQDPDRTPPGQDPNRTPPGQDPNRTPGPPGGYSSGQSDAQPTRTPKPPKVKNQG